MWNHLNKEKSALFASKMKQIQFSIHVDMGKYNKMSYLKWHVLSVCFDDTKKKQSLLIMSNGTNLFKK